MKEYDSFLIINDEEITIDGTPTEDVSLSVDELGVTFSFASDSYNLDILKSKQFGGRLCPHPSALIKINDIFFDIMAYGATNDDDNEISFFLHRSKK